MQRQHGTRGGVLRPGLQRLDGVVGVDAGLDAVLRRQHQLGHPRHLGIQAVGGDQPEHPGHLHRIIGGAGREVRHAEDRQASRRRLGVPGRLDGCQLHLLVVGERVARRIAQHDDGQRRRQAERRGDHHGAPRHPDPAAAEQVDRGDAQHRHRRDHVAGADGVDELGLRHGVEQHSAEVGDLHAHRLGVEPCADGVLHPAVGDQDPQRRQVGADRDHERREQVAELGQPGPAEEHQADEGRLQEEGHQPLDGERRAEDIAGIGREIRPVGAELELHGQAGGDAEHEVDAEDGAPEPRDGPPDLAPGHHIDALHDDQHEGQPERQRHEQEMVQRRQGELQP